MYLALFSLVTVAGAWAAWRSNPLYSTRATLRFVGIVGLAIVCVTLLIAAVVNATADAPALVFAVALAAAILVGTIVLIWIITNVSSPAVPAPSSGAPVVHMHRARVAHWARLGAAAAVVLGIATLVVPADGKVFVGGLATMFVFIGVTTLFAAYIAARRMDLALTALEADCWIRWRYTAEQWRTWTDAEPARELAEQPRWVWRRDGKRLILPAAAVVAGVALFDPGPWWWKASYPAGLFVLAVVIVELSARYERNAPRRLHALLMRAPPETYFGTAGVFADGAFTWWQTASNFLLDAHVEEGSPRSVALRFEEIRVGTSPVRTTLRVLVPPAADDDLARLQGLLSAACPSAHVALSVPAAGTA